MFEIPDKYVFVDLETTGGRVNFDRVIEIGILRIENSQLVDSYSSLINPQTYVSPFIENMTGIHNEQLTSAPTFEEIKEHVLELLSDSVFVAHNVRFDYGFLRNEFQRFDIQFSSKHFCTAKLSKYLYPQYTRHSLDEIISRFGFVCKNRHRAYDDAKVLWDFFQLMQKEHDKETLSTVLSLALKNPSIPSTISEKELESLPELPGVYIFYGENEIPLYVGKSINIKERVLSHFSSDFESSREMSICSHTTRIETMVTAGELGALIKESQLIKTMQPLYNRRLRHARQVITIREKVNTHGYKTISIDESPLIDVADLEFIIGVFKSRQQAKNFLRAQAKEYELCEKYLGLEKAKGSCFGHKIGQCRGACLYLEDAPRYNMRFTMAFASKKIKDWPFDSPIVIQEYNNFTQVTEGFLVDKWCMIGKITQNEFSREAEPTEQSSFSIDTYKILLQYILSPKNKHNIRSVNVEQYSQLLNTYT